MPSKSKKKSTKKSARNIARDPVVHGFVVRTSVLVPETEFSPDFVQGMYDRMAVSYFKYGAVAKAYPEKVNALKSLQQRIDKYLATGNTEFLIDAANFAMIEFLRPSLNHASFFPTDARESPGRTKQDGTITTRGNLDLT